METAIIETELGEVSPAIKNLRAMVKTVYGFQFMRIITGNRIAANFRSKLGLKPSEKEKEDKESQKTLVDLRVRYKRITDGIANEGIPKMKNFKGDELITEWGELALLENYFSLLAREEKMFRQIEMIMVDFPIYSEFLHKIKGCGPAMSAIIVSCMDIRKAKYVSSLWKYSGLAVMPDGKAQSMRKEHLVLVKYKDKDGVEKEKLSITFNPFVKSKMLGVLASSFLRSGNDKYAPIYQNYKHRLENHAIYKDTTKLHRHRMASRYMIKEFYKDLYATWRPIEGLPVHPEYSIAKLGMIPHGLDVDYAPDEIINPYASGDDEEDVIDYPT